MFITLVSAKFYIGKGASVWNSCSVCQEGRTLGTLIVMQSGASDGKQGPAEGLLENEIGSEQIRMNVSQVGLFSFYTGAYNSGQRDGYFCRQWIANVVNCVISQNSLIRISIQNVKFHLALSLRSREQTEGARGLKFFCVWRHCGENSYI